jgi:hypothetical protein
MRGSVRGCVVLADTGVAVPHATVEVVPKAGSQPDIAPVTDETGWFQFDALPEGSWLISASGPACETGTARVYVFDNALSDLMIEVKRSVPEPMETGHQAERPSATASVGGTVRGRVARASNGGSVANATVAVLHRNGVVQSHTAPPTDAAGSFAFEGLPPGPCVLSAVGPRGEAGTTTVYVSENTVSEVTIEVAGQPSRPQKRNNSVNQMTTKQQDIPGSVRGRVQRAEDAQPVADATISIIRGAGPAPDIAPITNQQGRFSLDGLPPGEWHLGALGPGGETGQATVRVSPGAVSNVVIELLSGGQ